MKIRWVSILMAAVLLLTAILPVSVLAAYENTYQNTGDQRADIIGVARTQVGYIEEAGGYTKYGAWFGRPYEDWCGIFVSWCAEQAGIPTSVLRKNGMATPSGFGFSTYYSSSQYTPKPGDLFFTKSFSHAGIVYYVEGDSFYTLEGNTWHNGSPHGVMTKKRALKEHYFVSPNYNGSGGSLPAACSHSWKDNGIVKESGCTTNGSKSQICEKCSQTRTVSISAKGHSFGDWTSNDEKQHCRTCKNCDKVETKQHDEMKWLSDGAGHWKECGTCKEQFQIEAHFYAGGCGTKCTVCDFASQDGHNYGSWQADDTGHWQICVSCEKESEHQEHNYPADCAEICTDCGYQRVSVHTYGQNSDINGHWNSCTVCGKEEKKEPHTPGEEASEEAAQLCTNCGFEVAPRLEHIHTYTYTSNRLTHQGQCLCGNMTEVENHIWSMEESVCSVCGAEVEMAEKKIDWDVIWIGAGAIAVAGTALIIILLLLRKRKKGK